MYATETMPRRKGEWIFSHRHFVLDRYDYLNQNQHIKPIFSNVILMVHSMVSEILFILMHTAYWKSIPYDSRTPIPCTYISSQVIF